MAQDNRPETITEQVMKKDKAHWLIRYPVNFVTKVPERLKFLVTYVFRILPVTAAFIVYVYFIDLYWIQQASDWYVHMMIWTPIFAVAIVIEFFFVTKYRAMEITRKYIGSYYATVILVLFLIGPWLFQWWYNLEIVYTHTRWFVILILGIIDQIETIGGYVVGNRALVDEEIVAEAKNF